MLQSLLKAMVAPPTFIWLLPCLISKILCISLVEKSELESKSNEQVHVVSGLIRDWNFKHQTLAKDVIILNFGGDSDVAQDVRRSIPEENPVLVLQSSQCSGIRNSRAGFVIIVLAGAKIDAVSQ